MRRRPGVELELHEESRQRIETYFKGRYCGENQYKQAMLPKGCTVFPNDAGTAPGCGLETDTGKVVIMLPGPPAEMERMLQALCGALSGPTGTGGHRLADGTGLWDWRGRRGGKNTGSDPRGQSTVATYAKRMNVCPCDGKGWTQWRLLPLYARPVVREVCARLGTSSME